VSENRPYTIRKLYHSSLQDGGFKLTLFFTDYKMVEFSIDASAMTGEEKMIFSDHLFELGRVLNESRDRKDNEGIAEQMEREGIIKSQS
jgi:hypothetical protein